MLFICKDMRQKNKKNICTRDRKTDLLLPINVIVSATEYGIILCNAEIFNFSTIKNKT